MVPKKNVRHNDRIGYQNRTSPKKSTCKNRYTDTDPNNISKPMSVCDRENICNKVSSGVISRCTKSLN